ncbi:DUF1476 domain-containing protein [Parvularcula maris]|uniref:DUF1476 domain-containing protein n=1 Tax=Parvularcula maris TaxID=2965077 RepID=A0A9X2L7Q4_9PROT|nr:DUF1476 domain-containing protein [Parvularcula maris]MCQ8184610.1 DUF1476 domain-containing protein [Parvularcula maris]
MTTFDNREQAFENEFAHDQEKRFKVEAKRDRYVGLWAAEKLGKTAGDADEYAKSVIRADLKEPGDNDVFEKLRADLPKNDISDQDIRKAMTDALQKAMDEVRKG